MLAFIRFIQTKWRFFIILFIGLIGLSALGIKGFLNVQDVSLKIKSKNLILRSSTQNAPRGTIVDNHNRRLAVDVPFYEYRLDTRFLHARWYEVHAKTQAGNSKFTLADYLSNKEVEKAILSITKILSLSKKQFNQELLTLSKKKANWKVKAKTTLQEHVDFQSLKKNLLLAQKITIKKHTKKYRLDLRELRKKAVSKEQLQQYIANAKAELSLLKTQERILKDFLRAFSSYEFYQRRYPYQNVFSQILGHIQIGKKRKPFDGVEKKLDHILRGNDGFTQYHKNFNGERYPLTEQVAMRAGKDVQLTLDYRLQNIVNKELYKQLQTHRAISASALLVDAANGAIRAVASQPNYNPNNSSERTAYRTRLRPLHDYIEAGSVQKPLLIAAGLESGELARNSTVSITRINHFKWRNSPFIERRYSKPTAVGIDDVIKHSINTGIVKFAERVNKQTLWNLYRQLGYGSSYDIYDARKGLSTLAHSDSWGDNDYYTRTYGYSEKLNIFNLITFYLAIANQGVLPPLHLLPMAHAQIHAKSKRIFSTETVSIMNDLLHQVTNLGSGKFAQVKGYRVAGKTGTTRKGGVSILTHRATFIGFAPLENPRYVLAVIVDEPSQNEEFYSGGRVAAPVFSRVMEQALQNEIIGKL